MTKIGLQGNLVPGGRLMHEPGEKNSSPVILSLADFFAHNSVSSKGYKTSK